MPLKTVRFYMFIALRRLCRSHLERFGLKSDLSLRCGAHVLSGPRFSRLDRPLAPTGSKVCSFIVDVVCIFRNLL